MISFAKDKFKSALKWGWLFCLPFFVTAQGDQLYSDQMQVGDYTGKAEYTYAIVEGDTVLDGPFVMQKSDLEALLNKEDASFLFKGAFEDGYAHGPWRFQFGAFESDSESQVVDYEYRVLISGVQEEASGRLEAGKPDGTWNFTVNRIKDSEIESTLFKSSTQFDNGVPQRNFNIENENSSLVGRFLRDGLAHDEWSLYTSDGLNASESWQFDEGILRSITLQNEDRSVTVPIFNARIQPTRTITLDARYINALQLQQDPSDSLSIFSTQMPLLLGENASHYQKIDDILSDIGKSEFLPQFKVKVPYFPMDSTETARMDSIASQFRKSESIGNALLQNSQLNLLKRSDEEALFLYESVKKLSSEFLGPLDKLVTYYDENILEFAPLEQIISRTFPSGKPSEEIIIKKFGDIKIDRSFSLSDAERYDFEGNDLESVSQLSEYAFRSLDSIQQVLDRTLTADQRQQELVSFEKKMIEQSDSLSVVIDSLSDRLPKAHRKSLESLQNTFETILSEYSSAPETAAKLDRARDLTNCFSQMVLLANSIVELPKKQEQLEELYQDAIWNPFMATVMNEEVKKRITSAYQKVLVPYFLQQASSINCQNIDQLLTEMAFVDKRMQQLRAEDTRKLERKLRREDDPKRILELIGQSNKSEED